MNKLGEILTIVLVSSSVFVLLDSAKRNLRPEAPAPAVIYAPLAQAPLPAVAPALPPNWAKADESGLRDALWDSAPDREEQDEDITCLDGSQAGSNAPVSDRASYLMDAGDAEDIVVSAVFKNKRAAGKAMAAAADKLKSDGKPVLFTSLMRESSGGFFYLIRMEPSAADVTRENTVTSSSEQIYINSLKGAAARLENDCRSVLQAGRK